MPQIKVGLEIHGYVKVNNKTKLFCECSLKEAEPNTNICPICTGYPGSKPMLPNKEAIDKIISIAIMLDCKINKKLLFQRKHYSWPDLPNGYQRTMSGTYAMPVGLNGNFLSIGIEEIHLEEDPARWEPETGYIDYNRSGFPLVEIVTKPDFSSAGQVRDWLKKLMTTLSYIDAIEESAGVKADVNVSIAPDFNRIEIKNINSFKSIVKAIEYEIVRQEKELKEGKKIGRETRTWDNSKEKTIFMRVKETAQDYMFIPEPDLPIIKAEESYVKKIAEELPEKPEQRIHKYTRKYKVPREDAEIISSEIMLADLYEEVAKEIDPILAAKWFRREILRVLHYSKKELSELEIEAKHIIQLLRLVETERITENVAKKILEKLIEKPFDVDEYVKEHKLVALVEKVELEKICREAIKENPKAVEDHKRGNEKAIHYIIGSVMAKTKGTATPKEVNEILKRLIK